jgi:vancomycin resistance protein YoaR
VTAVRLVAALGVAILIAVTSVVLAGLLYRQFYADRIFPGVRVDTPLLTADLGGQEPDVARRTVAAPHERYLATPLRIGYRGREWPRTPRELGLRIDPQPTIEAALAVGRAPGLFDRMRQQLLGLRLGVAVPPPNVSLDEPRLTAFVGSLAAEIEAPPTRAELAMQADGRIVVLPSQSGRHLDVARSTAALRDALLSLSTEPVALVVEDVTAPLAEGDLESLRRLAERAIGTPLVVEAALDGQTRQWRLETSDLAGLIYLRTDGAQPPRYELGIDDAKLLAHVERIAAEIERPAEEGRFAREGATLRVLKPSVEGRRVAVGEAMGRLRDGLLAEGRRVQLPWQPVRSAYAESEIGPHTFPDQIERAVTLYGGTLPERMHNVELAASRLNGVVVAPGAVFSFNESVGEVSYRSGYKRGFGISREDGEVVTIPSEGGGICQVATTLFQSVFWGGYQVVERNWHSYWIPRYGQKPRGLKGLDATVDQVYDVHGKLAYAVDLRWRNNTEAPILVMAETDGQRLSVTLWGHRPAWQVKVTEPKVEKVVKADTRPVRQPDATLKPGREIMIEHAEDGFQSTIVRTILRDGLIADETRFVSTYRPSRNVYLFGGAATAPPARSDDRPATPAPAPTGSGFITPVPSPSLPTATPRPTNSTTPRATGTTTPRAGGTTTPRTSEAAALTPTPRRTPPR